MRRLSSMRLVRKGKRTVRGRGYLVTWDVDSANRAVAYQVWIFLFGRTVCVDGRSYRYEGFLWKDGVRYLGQSVVFVRPHRLDELRRFLAARSVDSETDVVIFP